MVVVGNRRLDATYNRVIGPALNRPVHCVLTRLWAIRA